MDQAHDDQALIEAGPDQHPERWVYLPRPVYTAAGHPRGRIFLPGPLAGLGAEVAGHEFQRLLGFWFCWHALGGFDGMLGTGLWSKSGIYRQVKDFRDCYGVGPDELLPEFAGELRREAADWPGRFRPRTPPDPRWMPHERSKG